MNRSIDSLLAYKNYNPDTVTPILNAVEPYLERNTLDESALVALIEQAEFLDGMPGFSADEILAFEAAMGAAYETQSYMTFHIALNERYRAETASHSVQGDTAYPNGEVVFLIGDLNKKWAQKEYSKFAPIARWLAENGFKTVIHLCATDAHVREAAKNPDTRCIIWSGHGGTNGMMHGSDGQRLSWDSFKSGNDSRLKQIVLSVCNGEEVSSHYSTDPGVQRVIWKGTTYTKDLFDYLMSNRWDPR